MAIITLREIKEKTGRNLDDLTENNDNLYVETESGTAGVTTIFKMMSRRIHAVLSGLSSISGDATATDKAVIIRNNTAENVTLDKLADFALNAGKDATLANLSVSGSLSGAGATALVSDRVPTSRTINSHALTSDVTITKSDVGLSNVNNTSDANKPISTATQTALNGKQATLVSGTNIKTINNTSLLGSGNIPVPTIDDTKTDTTHVWSSNKTNGEITKFVTCNTSATTLAKDIGSTTYTTGTRLAILFTNGHTKVGTKTGNKVTSNYPTIGGHPIKVGGEYAGENFVSAGDVHELIYDGSSFHDITADVIYKGGDATNGFYEKKRNGKIEQRGMNRVSTGTFISFPIIFSEKPTVVCTREGAQSQQGLNLTAISTSGFTPQVYGGATGNTYNWISAN